MERKFTVREYENLGITREVVIRIFGTNLSIQIHLTRNDAASVRKKRKSYMHISLFQRQLFRREFFALCGSTTKSRAKFTRPAINNFATKLIGFGDITTRTAHVIRKNFCEFQARFRNFIQGACTSTEREVGLIEGLFLKTNLSVRGEENNHFGSPLVSTAACVHDSSTK